jgi:signal transduction histidine kinase/streptogramin lyase
LRSQTFRFRAFRRHTFASARLHGSLKVVCLSLVALLLLLFPAAAQKENENNNSPGQPASLHRWGAVTLFHGLPSDRVRAIAQDAEGLMWFGTDGGLARYDGRRTQAVAGEGLAGKVLALKLDADGVLWVGTEGGAARLVGRVFRPVAEAAGKAITAIITPERGRAILASQDGAIFDCRSSADGSLRVETIPEKPLTSEDFERPGPPNLTSLAFKDGVLYVGTRSRGVLAIENATVREIQSRPRPFFVEAIEIDARGRLWYGAKAKAQESGLYQAADPLRPANVGAGLGLVTALRAGPRDDIWAGTDGSGAVHYDDTRLVEHFTFEGTAGGLRSDHVYSIFVDREEVVWFGTDRGVSRYDPHAPRLETISTDAQSNFVRTLFETTGGRLLGGTNRGLFIFDPAANAWVSPFSELAQKTIYAIAEDGKGRVLVGSAGGLYTGEQRFDESAEGLRLTRIELPDAGPETTDSVRAVAEFQGATYIAAFGRGLERLDGQTRTLVWPTSAQSDTHSREVVSLGSDKQGRLWIGTALAGLFLFDGKQVVSIPALDKLKGSAVWSIYDGGDDRLWVATARGLYLYHAGVLKEIAGGFDARGVVGIKDAQARAPEVWCATAGGGLLKILLDEELGAVLSRLDAEQGLPSQSAFAVLPVRAADGSQELLIGTNRGVARYAPGRVAPMLGATRIMAERIHQPEELRAGLNLEYPQDSLVLDVAAASSRTFPEQFQYAFLLYDDAGRIINRKFSHDAQFTMENLRPGKYRVVASAFSKDLIRSSPLSFEFRVAGAPFPWTSTALSVLLALALIALWWGNRQNRRLARTGSVLKDTNRQLAAARMQLANETEAERRRIARDLHDQTLADLRRLLMMTDRLPPGGDGEEQEESLKPSVFRAEIESISQEIRRICEDLSPSVLENVGLAAALEWAIGNAVTHSPPDCKFEYEFVADENLDERLNLSHATQMQVYRIAQEALSNICRHAAATRVRLGVEVPPAGDFVLTIEDDGRSFDPQERKVRKGRGLANIRARASLIEAEVNWSSREGGGTRFTLRKANAAKGADIQT